MWGLSLETNLKRWHSPCVSQPVSLSIYLYPRWSGRSACPSEPLCAINQHEASLDVEPSGRAWRNNRLFCRVPGVSLFLSFSPFRWQLIPGGTALISELEEALRAQGWIISHGLPPLSVWALGGLKKQGNCPVDLTVNSLGTQICVNTFWWSFFSTVTQLSDAEENLKKSV